MIIKEQIGKDKGIDFDIGSRCHDADGLGIGNRDTEQCSVLFTCRTGKATGRRVDDKLEFMYMEKNTHMMAQTANECKSNLYQMQLRPFNPNDAETILSWCKDKYAFRLWSANRYKDFPAKPEEMIRQYDEQNMHPLTAIVDDIIIGHILLRYPSEDKTVIRFGFVIVDDSKRGKGYGKQMLRFAIDYAQQELGAKCITLGVFCDNISAVECYKSVGFRIVGMDSYVIDGDEWKGFEMEQNK